MKKILSIQNLKVSFPTRNGNLNAISNISMQLNAGETLGIVGESGCGKSVTSLAIMGLLPPYAHIQADHLKFLDNDLLSMSEKELRTIRGSKLTMIFQDPMTSLNPCMTVGDHLHETLLIHGISQHKDREKKAIELLDAVGIPSAKSRLKNYPHQLSGGMCQRVMIALAIALKPQLLIADEPTTALDVTIQAQILSLLKEIQKEMNMAIILITHDLGVVAQMADRIQVMYAGEIIESGPTQAILCNQQHPYTHGLILARPSHENERKELYTIPGIVPDLKNRPSGCAFHPRCQFAKDICKNQKPAPFSKPFSTSGICHFPIERQI